MKHALGERARRIGQRTRTLAREHPTLALAAAAGAGAIVGVEFAIGALAGVAVTSLFAKQRGRELRAAIMRRGRDVLERERPPQKG